MWYNEIICATKELKLTAFQHYATTDHKHQNTLQHSKTHQVHKDTPQHITYALIHHMTQEHNNTPQHTPYAIIHRRGQEYNNTPQHTRTSIATLMMS